MKTIYKLTDSNLRTHNGFQYEIDKWYEAKGDLKQGLCSDAYFHGYKHSLLAILHNPIHANISNPILWKAEYKGKLKNDRDMKCGARQIRLIKQIKLPNVTLTNRIAYGILCSLEVYKEDGFQKWGKNWLNGTDRTYAAAHAAAHAAATAAYAAASAAEYANAAAIAADAAAAAAAYATTYATKKLNLIELAKQAMKVR